MYKFFYLFGATILLALTSCLSSNKSSALKYGEYSKNLKCADYETENKNVKRNLMCNFDFEIFFDDSSNKYGLKHKSKIILKSQYQAITCPGKDGNFMVPNNTYKKWCPYQFTSEVKKKFENEYECENSYYGTVVSHHDPEKLASNPFDSSVLWHKKMLEYCRKAINEPPKFTHDGYGS